MRYISLILAIIMCVSCFTPVVSAEEQEVIRYYVSVSGNDANKGTQEAPFKTIEAARDAVRNNRDRKNKRIEVIFEEGTYKVDEAVLFEYKDSGAKGSPIVYKAAEGAKVSWSGGIAISKDLLKPVEDNKILESLYPEVRDKIRMVDLTQIGVNSVAGIDMMDHTYTPELAPITFYTGDTEMLLGRYPNEGETLIRTGKVVDTGSNRELGDTDKRPGAFKYLDDRIEKWQNIEDVWMWGEWYWAWAPSTTNIGRLDTENDIIYTGLWSAWGYQGDKPYYYFNVLEEIDVPGEYYIDRKNCKVYLYPVDENQDMYLTELTDNIIRTDNASHIRFENIIIQGSRTHAVDINDGEDIRIDGCTIKDTGKKAVYIHSGYEHKVINNEMYNLGTGGVMMDTTVGDMEFLVPSNTIIENNHIYDFSKWVTAYSEAIRLDGVGNIARYNTIHGTSHMAVRVNGINSIFEYNEVYDAVRDNDDAGAVYMFYNSDSRNCKIRYNYFHGIAKRKEKSSTGCWTIYYDGFHSDKDLYGNIFKDLSGGVHINGGHMHNMYSNLFIDVDTPFWLHYINVQTPYEYWQPLNALPYDKGIWKQTFPEATWREKEPEPTYAMNYLDRNICYDSGPSSIDDPHKLNDLHKPVYIDASVDAFVDLSVNDWTFKIDHGVEDFYVPTVSEIGIREERVIYE